jgi:hypothetical protein
MKVLEAFFFVLFFEIHISVYNRNKLEEKDNVYKLNNILIQKKKNLCTETNYSDQLHVKKNASYVKNFVLFCFSFSLLMINLN